jgi:Ca-activated chloride channel family protein
MGLSTARWILLGFALALQGSAQQIVYPELPESSQPPASSQQPISVQVNEVVVPVTVTDDKGRFVSNLDSQDFQILDQGHPQTIQYFTRERNQPVVIGFLIDLSNSSRTQWKNFEQAAEELVVQMLPGDKKFAGYLIGYGNEAELMVNTTSDSEKILEKLRKLKPAGGAALFDAIYQACTSRALIQGEPVEPRRVIVVIGDGNDNASSKTLNQVLELAQRNLVTIYGVSTTAFGFTSEGNGNLVRLTEETGGRMTYPLQDVYKKDVSGYLSTPSDEGNYALQVGTGGYASMISGSIFRAIADISGEITTQYILRYTPDTSNTDTSKPYRNIEVKVSLANVTVRARKGYYPSSP